MEGGASEGAFKAGRVLGGWKFRPQISVLPCGCRYPQRMREYNYGQEGSLEHREHLVAKIKRLFLSFNWDQMV